MQQLDVGWFGKLPFSPEFLKWNDQGRVVQDLDQVFSKAIYCSQATGIKEWKTHFLKSTPIEFMFQPKGNLERLIGMAFPSQDQAGRVFPFLLFIRGWKPVISDSVTRDPIRWFPWLTHVRSYIEGYKRQGWDDKNVLAGLKTVVREPFDRIRSDQEIDMLYEAWVKNMRDKENSPILKAERFNMDQCQLSEARGRKRVNANLESRTEKVELLSASYGENFDVSFGIDLMSQATNLEFEWTGIFWRRGQQGQGGEVFSVNNTLSDSQFLALILPNQEKDQKEEHIEVLKLKEKSFHE